ncbi:MAG TPA: hypothetical protein VF459_09125 [Caulobacteraceae bacterium]
MAVDDFGQPAEGRAGAGSSAPAEANLIGRLLMGTLQILPFLFGIGFIAPLIVEGLKRALPAAAHASWPILVGLAAGGSWGAVANLRGRWL